MSRGSTYLLVSRYDSFGVFLWEETVRGHSIEQCRKLKTSHKPSIGKMIKHSEYDFSNTIQELQGEIDQVNTK